MQPSIRARERHALQLADRPDRVEVADQEDLRRAASELGEQVIAAIGSRQARDASADRFEAAGELRAAAIDGGLVGRRRLEAHQRLGRLEQPLVLGATEFSQVV